VARSGRPAATHTRAVAMAGEPSRPVLLYDGGCRFCRFAARMISRLDRDGRIAMLPFDDPAASRYLERVPVAEQTRSIHLAQRDGRVLSADAALAGLLDQLTPLPRVASRALGHLYEPVARRRDRIGPHVPDGEAPRRYP
jgi:predicted DCC family thiol-disulfide oxidoreductase YuxK